MPCDKSACSDMRSVSRQRGKSAATGESGLEVVVFHRFSTQFRFPRAVSPRVDGGGALGRTGAAKRLAPAWAGAWGGFGRPSCVLSVWAIRGAAPAN